MKLVCLSNGHGEDIIAVQILEQLLLFDKSLEITALPLVGEGYAYSKLNIPIISPVQQMPSGGFIYMDSRQLWRDIKGGLIKLTLNQHQSLQEFVNNNSQVFIIAVGDIFPLLFAWLTKVNYAFIGTAKSEYYLRDEYGWLSKTTKIERSFGSVYLPWERFLMKNRRCLAVYPRDTLTTQILQKFSIRAKDLGNPMMDNLMATYASYPYQPKENQPLTIVLLPGSRMPEAFDNWQLILTAVSEVLNIFPEVLFLAAIAPSLNNEPFLESLINLNWKPQLLSKYKIPINDRNSFVFTYNKAKIILSQNAYTDFLNLAHLAIAMAGTATEQFVGLGKPAFILPGNGPQFTPAFAEAQTRLLGCSVILVNSPAKIAQKIKSVISNPDRLNLIEENGKKRMGKPGAARRIASDLMTILKKE